MKIGIVTVHSVPNYGAVLQAYALSNHLRASGADAWIVDYRQPQLEEMYRFRWSLPPRVNHWLRLNRNATFVEKSLPLAPGRCRSVAEFVSGAGSYDAFITGSDQVWFTGPVQYFDPMYFLDFDVGRSRKISYAASAGGTTHFGEFEPRVREALAGFSHIGVRDSHTAQLVSPLSPHAPVQVVDPVFLCDFPRLIAARPPMAEPYLLVFGDFNGRLSPVLQSIIQATGLSHVVSLQYPCAVATRRVAAPGPAEWLTWFRHAAFVVTSYFHGTAVAVKFERPFISIPTPGRRIKVATLLDGLDLGERCFLAETTPDEMANRARLSIYWSKPRQLLEKQIANSQAFLKEALR